MPKPSPSKLVLLDNTILTNFAVIQQAELLQFLWPTASTVQTVIDEYQVGINNYNFPADSWKSLPIIVLNQIEVDFAEKLSSALGAGERDCLAVAYHRQGLFVSDDNVARKQAKAQGILVSGTLGALVALVRKGQITLAIANNWLSIMIQQGYRSPLISLDRLI